MEWTQESDLIFIELYKRKEKSGTQNAQLILTKLEIKMHGKNWGKE